MKVPFQVEGDCTCCKRPILSGVWQKIPSSMPAIETLGPEFDSATYIPLCELEVAGLAGSRCPACEQPTFEGLVSTFVPTLDQMYGPGAFERLSSCNT